MAASFKASLITPEAIVLETPVTQAQVPAFDGLVGIMHQRAPLLAKLGTGVLRLDTATGGAGGRQEFLVSGGYAQMKDDELTILTTEAIPAEKVTPEFIAGEQAKLSAVTGTDVVSLDRRQAIEARIRAAKQMAKG
ncbi:MAG TPA: F0F1 ATP synthase subunit epsilon [Phycisphaerae bacterium]|nr:F0F1 ATP synthase subunit epsilon [Phycisphaerae bacterium]